MWKKIFLGLLIGTSMATATEMSIQGTIDALTSGGSPYPLIGLVVIENNEIKYYFSGSEGLSENSIFEIGSNTKVFTGILLADAILKEEVRLSDSINGSFDKQLLPQDIDGSIDLRSLITHTSGLPRMPANFNPQNEQDPYADYSFENMKEYLSEVKLRETIPDSCEKDELDIIGNQLRKSGSCFNYSNLGISLVGQALSTKLGQPFSTLLEKRVISQLGMHDTSESLGPDQEARLVQGYDWDGNPSQLWSFQFMSPAGSLKSTLKDMGVFLKNNLEPSSDEIGRAIEKAMAEKIEVEGRKVGMGWQISDSPNGRTFWHNGGTYGFSSFMGVDTNKRAAVFIFGNQLKLIDGNIDSRIDNAGFRILESL